jgi:anti-anti-sigma factor
VDLQGRPILHQDRSITTDQRYVTAVAGIDAAVTRQAMPLFYQGLNPSREWVIGSFAPSETVRWLVIAEQPLPWIVQSLRPLVYATVGILVLSGLAALVVGRELSRRVAQPIVQLRAGAKRIGAGDLAHRIALPNRHELTELANEFNQMAENLMESQAQLEDWSRELEGRIAERTHKLRLALEQLQQEAETHESLLSTIRHMSSPVIPITKDIMVLPLVGTLDSERAQQVMTDLLSGIERNKTRAVIIDITGLAIMDTAVANALLQTTRAAQLLGAQPVMVGISPAVAETIVYLGIDLQDLRTAATLQEGLALARKLIRH